MEDWETKHERQHEALDSFARGLVGQMKADAATMCADLGLQVRMIDWDLIKGPVALHGNYVADRVTVFVKQGVVTKAEAG